MRERVSEREERVKRNVRVTLLNKLCLKRLNGFLMNCLSCHFLGIQISNLDTHLIRCNTYLLIQYRFRSLCATDRDQKNGSHFLNSHLMRHQ